MSACRRFGVSFDAAMDAGCGPGGTALQLCLDFKHVEAYDYSQGFVDMMLAKRTEKVCCVFNLSLKGDKSTILKADISAIVNW